MNNSKKFFPLNLQIPIINFFKCREMLQEVVSIHMQYYEITHIKSQSADDFLKAFFDSELMPLWPPGWMQPRFHIITHSLKDNEYHHLRSLELNIGFPLIFL